ncbi:flavin reductase [Pseudoalteromonas sp. MMG010]|uniref:flavin reductase family protein n=1 Tax=Pseudoalteromonas sp. MMG010 TaxID=2822685 RepID=UPI001B39D75A|nr:flavin reductase [Pseudoalteromonas sp. MMG010]MBQ4833387.1 flavin reductase [Pseudoalteromonas sp. MMG010]
MIFNTESISKLEKKYRTHLINSLSGFKSANLIGTQDLFGNTNLAIVSSVFHLGAHPPLVGMIIRPHSSPRHTLENIIETGFYTINQVNGDIYKQAHQTSARYDKFESEFDNTGLTKQYLGGLNAPYVKQSRLKYGVKLVENQCLSVNDTQLVIGLIVEIHVDDKAIDDDGFVNLQAIDTVALSGLDCYHSTEKLARLPYAKK